MEKMLHAYILSGGGEATAKKSREMAAAVLCEGTGPRPCRSGRHCRKVFRGDFPGIHPDVTAVVRTANARGALRSEIGVEQIRDLVRDASVLPNEAAAKVYIFPEADAMNVSAQNAFLKLLEEPPAFVTFLLCTENPERLLPTVRSRCGEVRADPARTGPEGQARERAEGYLAARNDRAELLRCCAAMERLENPDLLEVVEAIRALAPETKGLTPEELLFLEDFVGEAERYLRARVGVKHVTGYLSTYVYTRK